MKVLDIALKDVLRFMRNRFFIMLGIGVPLLMAVIFYFAFGGQADGGFTVPETAVCVVNLDRPVAAAGDFAAGKMLIEFLQADALSEILDVEVMADTMSARAAVDAQEAAVAVIIPENLTASLVDPQGRATVEIYQDPTLILGPAVVKGIVTQFVDMLAGARIAATVAYDRLSAQGLAVDGATLQEVATRYGLWSASLSQGQQEGVSALLAIRPPVGTQQKRSLAFQMATSILAGMMVFYAFFTGAAGALSFLQEEEDRTLPRLFTTPTPTSAILGGKFIAVFLIVALQVLTLILISSPIFGVDWGAPLPLAVALTMLVILAATFGIFTMSWLKDTSRAGIVIGGVMTVMGMVGMVNAFMGNAPVLSPTLKILPLVVPQGWANRALQLVMDGGGLGDILFYIAVMLGLAALFFAIGVFRFGRRFA